ncbi:MAG: hypothetical protein GY810_11565 [Aureispira sp.]|nr:hypothetical protein [Aureispira sp.]
MHKLLIIFSILVLGLFFSACNSSYQGGENTSAVDIPQEQPSARHLSTKNRTTENNEMALEDYEYSVEEEEVPPGDIVTPGQNTEE